MINFTKNAALMGAALMMLFTINAPSRVKLFDRIGARPLVLGLTSWALIAAIAYAGVRIAWT